MARFLNPIFVVVIVTIATMAGHTKGLVWNGTITIPADYTEWMPVHQLNADLHGYATAHVMTRIIAINGSFSEMSQRASFSVAQPAVSYLGPIHDIEGVPTTVEEWFGPCEANAFLSSNAAIAANTLIYANSTTGLNVTVQFTAVFTDSSVGNDQRLRVPTAQTQYFTVFPAKKPIKPTTADAARAPDALPTWNSYYVTLTLTSDRGNRTIAQRFQELVLGCYGGTGSAARQSIDLSTVKTSTYTKTFRLSGPAGPAYIQLIAHPNGKPLSRFDDPAVRSEQYPSAPFSPDFNLTLVARLQSDDDSGQPKGLTTWQIAMIAIGAAGVITFLVLIPTAYYLRVRERNRKKALPEGPQPVQSGGGVLGIRQTPGRGEARDRDQDREALLADQGRSGYDDEEPHRPRSPRRVNY